MRKISLLIFCLFYLMMTTNSDANYAKETEATRENLLEDAVLDLLHPLMGKAMKDYYGTTYNMGTHCERVLNIKKLDHPGSWLFDRQSLVSYKGYVKKTNAFMVVNECKS
jgi:hypothetical protein